MPPASRISDMHTCPMVNPGPVPHVGGPDISGSPNVIVGFMPQARVGDSLICVPAIDKIAKGSPTVLVNGKMAARIGDPTVHGGVLVAGCPTVIIGESGQGSTLRGAARDGTPFCEECEKLKKQLLEAEELQKPPPNVPPPGSANVVTPDGQESLAASAAAANVVPVETADRNALLAAIKPVAQDALLSGEPPVSVAEWAKKARDVVMEAYEIKDHWDVLEKVYERNQDKFGDLGPSVEFLISEKGKTAREIIDAAAAGNLSEKLAELQPEIIDRVAEKLIENEHVRTLVVAAVDGKLPEGLGDLSGQAIDKVLEGVADEDTLKVAKPLIDKLKEQVAGKVSSLFGGG